MNASEVQSGRRPSVVSAYTSAVDAAARGEFERVLSFMSQKLKSVKYHGSYFDRGAEPGSRLCTPEGWFSCQGPFDMDSCLSKHSINPYGNRESRILFSTWNLDHMQLDVFLFLIPRLACGMGAKIGGATEIQREFEKLGKIGQKEDSGEERLQKEKN